MKKYFVLVLLVFGLLGCKKTQETGPQPKCVMWIFNKVGPDTYMCKFPDGQYMLCQGEVCIPPPPTTPPRLSAEAE